MPLSFSDERGTGTFHSLGVLPKRKQGPVFHIHPDVDDTDAQPHSIPFPRSISPSTSSTPSSPSSPRPPLSRGVSAPILLSNGKPLKSSLKTSPSTPLISIPPEAQAQHLHLRARSEPATPAKNVHFPEKDYALATVRVFRRSARPAALSNPANTNGDETETEGEDMPPTSFPFPPTFPPNYEIDSTKSSLVPCKAATVPHVILESLHLPPSSSASSPTMKVSLTGSVLVSNLAFAKNVAVRFTLDDWQTVSEVGAHYVDSLSLLPSHLLPSSSTPISSSPRTKGWDRFAFTIRLDDYIHSLSTRTLWLASRYRVDSTYPEPGSTQSGPGGEWWDNNRGSNYRVAFRPAVTPSQFSRGKPRRETLSGTVIFPFMSPYGAYSQLPGPIFPPRSQPEPPMTCKEHVSGYAVSNKTTLNETDKRSIALPAGKLCLSNYAPPTVAAASSVLFPSTRSPRNLSPSSITNTDSVASATPRPVSQSDEDTPSPASSALSTPSVSPTMAPLILINGHPATSVQPHRLHEDDIISSSKPGHIADWDWSASSDKLHNDMGLSRRRADPDAVPGVDPRERQHDMMLPQGCKALGSGNGGSKSLYDAFVTQWCFAQGPSPGRGYSDGGIMA